MGEQSVRISCPARLDVGNQLDYPSYFLSLASQTARTANIAIELRTSVSYLANRRRGITLLTNSISEHHAGSVNPAKSRFPDLCVLLRHFGVTSGTFRIDSQIPPRSGLGGSGALAIAMVALIKKIRLGTLSDQDWPTLSLITHLLENWLGFSSTGFQDQLAALYGGANLWTWGIHFDGVAPIYKRSSILPLGGADELNEHILLCFTGQSHAPTRMSKQVRRLEGSERAQWERVSRHTESFSAALRTSDWIGAARHLNAECDLRGKLDSTCLSARARVLVNVGRQSGVGCRYAGHGHGGCVWAIGDATAIGTTKEVWDGVARKWKGAWVIMPRVAAKGLVVHE